MNISVVGSGAWGTALSLLLHENGNDVTLWSYFDHETETMKKTGENPFLKGVSLPDTLQLTSDLSCVSQAEVVIMATPSFAVREMSRRIAKLIGPDTIIISVSKGIERETSLPLTEIITQEIGGKHRVAALSGPSHAEEVGRGIPTAVVAAAENIALAEQVQDLFMNERFRVYATDDVIGVEMSGALKNVIALCAGCCDGMGFGDNTLAMLMTRGLTEIARVGEKLGGKKDTFTGLAGMGDLIVTCTSKHSRNRRAGVLIGQGMTAQEAMKEVGSVVEGYYAAAAGFEMAQHYGVEAPIVEATFNVLYNNAPLKETFEALMTRRKRHETEEYWINE